MDGKNNYVYDMEFISNYDGDSLWIWISKTWDFGFEDYVSKRKKINVRLWQCDTPELRDKRPDFKLAAELAKKKTRVWIENEPCDFISLDKPDKYGRALGDFRRADHSTLVQFLLENNYAVRYQGQNKQLVQQAHERNIAVLRERGEI